MDRNPTEACNATITGASDWVDVVYCSIVAVLGTFNYSLALWCVASCTTTKRAMKVLLISMFVPAMLICVLVGLMLVSALHSYLSCSLEKTYKVFIISLMLYLILELIDLACIAFIAVARAVVVWSSQGSKLGMGVAAALVVSAYAYPFVVLSLILLGFLGAYLTSGLTELTEKMGLDALLAYSCLCMAIPILVTLVAYALMIVAVQRNKRRLAASQSQPRPTPVMDQATRAMLAVFISNLVFGLPHSIYHLMGKLPHYFNVIFHILFSVHFVVDPLVFIYFNLHDRRRVVDLLAECGQRMTCWLPRPPPHSVSPLASSGTSLSSPSTAATSSHETQGLSNTLSGLGTHVKLGPLQNH